MKVLKKASIVRTKKDTDHTRAERYILEAVKVNGNFGVRFFVLSLLPINCFPHFFVPIKWLAYL
jgi:hypothetical protein